MIRIVTAKAVLDLCKKRRPTHHKKMPNPLYPAFALMAVTIFTLLEGSVSAFTFALGVPIFIMLRTVVEMISSCTLFKTVGTESGTGAPLTTRVGDIDILIHQRALAMLAFEICFIFTLITSQNQILAYPLYFTHIGWQLFFGYKYDGKRPSKKQMLQALIVGAGVLMYVASAKPWNELKNGANFFGSLVTFAAAPMLSGVLYALNNQLANEINKQFEAGELHCLKPAQGISFPVLGQLAHTYLALLYIVIPICAFMFLLFTAFDLGKLELGIKLQYEELSDYNILHVLVWLATSAIVGVLGAWLNSLAFAKSPNTGKIAAMDGFALALALFSDLLTSKYGTRPKEFTWPDFPILVAAILVLGVGIFWSALEKGRH